MFIARYIHRRYLKVHWIGIKAILRIRGICVTALQ